MTGLYNYKPNKVPIAIFVLISKNYIVYISSLLNYLYNYIYFLFIITL